MVLVVVALCLRLRLIRRPQIRSARFRSHLSLLEAPLAIVGAPFALVLELMLLGWAALGAALVWRAKSPRLAQLAMLLFAPAAIVGLVFRPDLIVLMRNMAV